MADDRPRGSWLSRLLNGARYTMAGARVLFGRVDLDEEQTMREINALRRKYGLKEWDL